MLVVMVSAVIPVVGLSVMKSVVVVVGSAVVAPLHSGSSWQVGASSPFRKMVAWGSSPTWYLVRYPSSRHWQG